MVIKYVPIFMMFTALAVLLGHNLVPHHHHGREHAANIHHYHGDHHHHDEKGDESDDNTKNDFGHLFSEFQHGENGITFLANHPVSQSRPEPPSPPFHVLIEVFVLKFDSEFVRKKAPPYKYKFYCTFNILPFGLRAPPISIV